MPSDVGIINLGLGKFASVRIRRLDPANTDLEVLCKEGYPQWRGSELSKRRWVFATIFNYKLVASNYDSEAEFPYTFNLPNDCLRPIREKGTTWQQSKRTLLAKDSELTLDYVRNAKEDEFDPLFVDVLAVRCAIECSPSVTEQRAKKIDLAVEYDRAVAEASRNNAFVIGPESVNGDDAHYPFLTARWE